MSSEMSLASANAGGGGGRRRSHLTGQIAFQRESMARIRGLEEEQEDELSEAAVEAEGVDDEGREQQLQGGGEEDSDMDSPARAERALVRAKTNFRRVSQVVADHPELTVEVRLWDASYHVPIKVAGSRVRTVLNQSLCWLSAEVCRRTYLYLNRKREEVRERTDFGDAFNSDGEWIPPTLAAIATPYVKRTILRDVNLCLRPGKVYLVLGPPGCGKTTLLKAIAGRLPDWSAGEGEGEAHKRKPHATGRIEYNGVAKEDDPDLILQNVVSYVGQLDTHAPYLTVKETFEFAFQSLTGGKSGFMGVHTSGVEKVHEQGFTENLTIDGLDLAHVSGTFVGNDDVRGVSGGQRRRVTVGEMMQGHNPVACADEISTGLDAAATYDIVRSVVLFAKAAKTTRVISLLQPGTETFSLFDEVIVLSEGRIIYSGPIDEVVEYFEGLGYKLPPTMDVADFLQTVPTPDGALLFEPPEGSTEEREHYTSERFAEAFCKSRQARKIREMLESPHPNKWIPKRDVGGVKPTKTITFDDEEKGGGGAGVGVGATEGRFTERAVPGSYYNEYQNSWSRSFVLNLKRHLTLWKRDKGFIIGKTAENIGMAAATGGILFGNANIAWDQPWTPTQANSEAYYKLTAGVYGALFMATFHILQGTMTASPDELDGRPIHYKHADANFYQSSAFVFGRLVSTFPQRCLEILAFGIPLYFMVGFALNSASFFIYFCILLTFVISVKLMFSIVATVLPRKASVQGLGTFVVLLCCLFGGFMVHPKVIPDYYIWLYYINPMAWAFQAFVTNEFTSGKYSEKFLNSTDVDIGASMLIVRGFPPERVWIGYSFAYFVPVTILFAIVLTVAMKYVRIEPTRSEKKDVELEVAAEDEEVEKFDLPFTPINIAFEDICYEVKASTGDEKLKLLNNINGVFKSGRLCALMGSSGAGKTTLMDVIAMRKTGGTQSGGIYLNGFPQERTSFLRCSGYVEQFDIQSPELTVRETIAFAARLRLDSAVPETSDDAGKMRFVDQIICMLELMPIEDEQVGSYDEGGLTFEQRKRLAIAVELAGSPSVLFLDEPTSGLDSRAAVLVMRLMRKIANTGRTICATIHQPSSAVFEMFDDLLLLKTGGKVVFFGELGKNSIHLTNFFESRGATPIEHGENPAAWMLTAATSKEIDYAEVFKSSEQFDLCKQKIQEEKQSPDESKRISYDSIYPTTWWQRNQLMNGRISRIYVRSPAYNLTRLLVAVLYAFIIGSIFIRQSKDNVWQESEVDGVLSTIFLSLIIIGVMSITMAVPVMKRIRDVFYKHRASGMMEHGALSVAVTVGETPYICLLSVLFCSVYYGTVNLFQSLKKFWQFWGFFALNNALYSYFGQAFICLVKDIPTAGALYGALIGTNVFFSGLIVRPQYFVGPFQIGYWFAPGRYAYEGIIVTQFAGLDDRKVQATPLSPFFFDQGCDVDTAFTEPCEGTMSDYVTFFFGGRFNENNLLLDIMVLLAFLVVTKILTWWSLKRFNYVNT